MTVDENQDSRTGSLGEVPLGPNGAVLVRERVREIGREAMHRVREEMQILGEKIAESITQGSEAKTMNGERGKGTKA